MFINCCTVQSYKFDKIWSKCSPGWCYPGLIKVKNLLSDWLCQGNATWNPTQGLSASPCCKGWVCTLRWVRGCPAVVGLLTLGMGSIQAGQVPGETSTASLAKSSTTTQISQHPHLTCCSLERKQELEESTVKSLFLYEELRVKFSILENLV